MTGLLERKYESKDRFTFIKSNERDEYGRELHLFHDKKNGIDFIVKSWIERNMIPFIPIIFNGQYWQGMKGCIVLQTEKTRIQNDIKELERMINVSIPKSQ